MRRRELLKAALAGFSAFPLAWTAAAEPAPQRILFYTASAGFQHSVVKRLDGRLSHAEQVLTEMGRRAGFEVECTRDGTVFDGDLSPYGAFAFYASGDLTKPNVDEAPPMTAAGKQRFLDAVAAGKGFVGFHAAADAFHASPPA
ncbi:MAG: ThuA domain-containing protein, partial [Thermoguttaceae bacterium]|nr:ThuA domain-containing protein [Thermoguttaceae bacterium]